MKILEKFLKNGLELNLETREQERQFSQYLEEQLRRKRYIQTSLVDETAMEVFLYDEMVCIIEIKNSALKMEPHSENFFEVMVLTLEAVANMDKKPVEYVEPEFEEESDEWI